MNVVTKLARLLTTLSVGSPAYGIVYSLQHGVAVETELILDHAIRNFLGHFSLWHFERRKVLGGKARAVNGGGELILSRRFEGDVLEAGHNGRTAPRGILTLVGIFLDTGEMHLVGGVWMLRVIQW